MFNWFQRLLPKTSDFFAMFEAHVATLVGCTERAAEFWLSGQRDWSGDAIAAIVSEILKRHSMRNVKITPRK